MNRFSAVVVSVFFVIACALHVTVACAVVVSVGHRGNSSVAPENTLSAIEAAYGKAWGVEYDTRITSDDHIILMHDTTVNRTTTGYGDVEDLSFSYIRSLDAGIKLFPEYAGEQVPTLGEALSTAAAGNLVSCVEVKAGSAADYLSEFLPYQSQIEVHCFDWGFLSNLNSLDNGFTLVALGGGSDLGTQLSSIPACVNKISWGYSGLTASNIAAAHAAGKEVYAWTVDNANTMLSLEAMGVDGIVTNVPALATRILNKQTDPAASMPFELHDGLMANWSFDDALGGGTPTTVADSVNGVDATLSPTVAVPESWQVAPNAKMGGALKFDGVDDSVSVPVDVATIPTRNAVTIASWVKLDKLPADITSYGSIYDSNQDSYVLYLDSGSNELRFKVTAGAAARPGIPGDQLDTTEWHLVTGVYDGGAGVARIYLDGNLMDVHADDSASSDGLVGFIGQQAAYFGSNGTATNGFFEGKIDETAVWERPLSQAEIAHLYNGGLGRPIQQTNPVIESVAPVVRLEFENNLTNQGTGGSTYNGQWINGSSGSASSYEAGVRDQALHLNVTADSDAVAVPITLGDVGTISFWCKPDSFYNYQTLFDNVSDDGDWEMWIYSSGVAKFRLEADSEVEFDLTTLGGADTWYHMAVTWFKAGDDVVLNLYVDGLVRDIDEGAWVDPGSEFYIGGGNTNNDFCNAAFDDFRIYDAMLSSDEILAIYAQKEAALLPYVPGDVNRDGVVDEEDTERMATYWGQSEAEWWMGDLDGDGYVGPKDASILAANWGYDASESSSAVPEPTITIFVITALIAMSVMGRKRRT